MSQHAEPTHPPQEPTSWFLIAAALAMTLWCALFFDEFVVSLRQVLGFALAGSERWSGARAASEADAMRPWLSCAVFALLGSGVSVGVVRRRGWAARALMLLWFATLPVIGIVLYAGFAASGQCVAQGAPLAQLRCLGVVGAMALVPVALWIYALSQIRRAQASWGGWSIRVRSARRSENRSGSAGRRA
jgi:hypothetical protein